MNVINQVLDQLEKRGAHIAAEQVMVRTVPQGRETINNKFIMLAMGLVVTGALLWQGLKMDKPAIAVSSHVQDMAIAKVVVSGSSSAPKSGVAVINTGAATSPNLQMSFELSSLVLSDPLHPNNVPIQPTVAKIKPLREPEKHSSIAIETPKNKPAKSTSSGASPMKQFSHAQQADGEFRKAAALMQQGHIADALAGYEAALRLDAGHDAARQALVVLLMENKRGVDAERVLQERLSSKPDHTGFTMMLARLQVERGAVAEATETLEKALPYANSQADFHAFMAALLQRKNRNVEAIAHYQIALQLAPNNGIWLMGYGISLEAAQRNADAKDAFRHALDTQTLSPELQAFVQKKISGF